MTWNSEEIKPVAFSIVELCLAEGITESVSHLVENRNFIRGVAVLRDKKDIQQPQHNRGFIVGLKQIAKYSD